MMAVQPMLADPCGNLLCHIFASFGMKMGSDQEVVYKLSGYLAVQAFKTVVFLKKLLFYILFSLPR